MEFKYDNYLGRSNVMNAHNGKLPTIRITSLLLVPMAITFNLQIKYDY